MMSINEGKKKAKEKIRESYEENSIISEVVQVKSFDPEKDSDKKFWKIPIKTKFPKKWFTSQEIYPYSAFESIGRSLAISEEKSLADSLYDSKKEVIETNLDSFNDILRDVLSELQKDKEDKIALFCPIDYYTELLEEYTSQDFPKIEWTEHQPVLRFDDQRGFKIFWSSKYVPLDEFLAVEVNTGNWIVKEDKFSDSRIQIEMNDKDSDIELIVKIVYSLELPDRDFLTKIEIL